MNYLVHLYLSGPDPQYQLGGLMGDFVKGRLPETYPAEMIAGMLLHRRIDSFSQTNRHTQQSKRRLNQKFGHGRGIIVDIFYDHFLAIHWSDFAESSLEDYAASVYLHLQRQFDILPEGLQQIVPRMIEYNWLVSYQHHDVVGKALHRIAQRLSRPLPLQEATEDLSKHRDLFYADFVKFMVEAKEFSQQQLTASRLSSSQ